MSTDIASKNKINKNKMRTDNEHSIVALLDRTYINARRDNNMTWLQQLWPRLKKFGTERGTFLAKATIDIGRYENNEYCILIESLNPVSVNADEFFGGSVAPIYKYLNFANIKGYPPALQSQRRVLFLGRLVGSHHEQNEISKWIVVMDVNKLIWALHADGVDLHDLPEDVTNVEDLRYDAGLDTAFGADPTLGDRAVVIAWWSDLPKVSGMNLKYTPKIFDLTWSTSLIDKEQAVKDGLRLFSFQRTPVIKEEQVIKTSPEPDEIWSTSPIIKDEVMEDNPAIKENRKGASALASRSKSKGPRVHPHRLRGIALDDRMDIVDPNSLY